MVFLYMERFGQATDHLRKRVIQFPIARLEEVKRWQAVIESARTGGGPWRRIQASQVGRVRPSRTHNRGGLATDRRTVYCTALLPKASAPAVSPIEITDRGVYFPIVRSQNVSSAKHDVALANVAARVMGKGCACRLRHSLPSRRPEAGPGPIGSTLPGCGGRSGRRGRTRDGVDSRQ